VWLTEVEWDRRELGGLWGLWKVPWCRVSGRMDRVVSVGGEVGSVGVVGVVGESGECGVLGPREMG
jgi:hypothetical protein